MNARRARERRRDRPPPTRRPPRPAAGVPIYDGFVVDVDVDREQVLLGVGPIGERPIAYLALCPTIGVRQLVTDIRDAAAPLAEHHCEGGHP